LKRGFARSSFGSGATRGGTTSTRPGSGAARRGLTLLDRPWERPTARDWADALAQLPLFSRCGKRHLRKLAGLAEFKEFAPGDVVIQAGDAPDALYLILSGRARVLGKPRARPLRTGDYFGEMGLIDGEPRSASITAVEELQLMKLPRRPFLKLLEQEPEIAVAMLAELAGRIRRLEKPAAER
jgi:CRP/FNR family transcriptional regulator, cyclic AMP receptor protein